MPKAIEPDAKINRNVDGVAKMVLQYKASLIAVETNVKRNAALSFARFIKNIQPISVGV
jgi:hypothetical protein